MATQKQIDANKRNAQNSTGPKSETGKNKTRLNAKRDGITGQVLTLSEEDRPVFENLKSELIADLAPKTTMELSLANSIAWDTWRLNHLRAVEMNLYALGAADPGLAIDAENPQIHTAMAAAVTFANESDKLARLSIYEQRLNRSIHKNLETLRKLQAERKAQYEKDQAEEILLARYCEIKGLAYQASARPNQNGFVFSNPEIFTATERKTTLEVAFRTVGPEPIRVQYAGAGAGVLDFPPKTAPVTPLTNLSTMPSGGAKPSFLSR